MPLPCIWTQDEDAELRRLVHVWGTNWTTIAKEIRTKCSKQCRRRWVALKNQHVMRKGKWSKHEDEQLVKGYRKWGNSWTRIAQLIGGRTDNAVKNRFTALSEAGIIQRKKGHGARGRLQSPECDDSFDSGSEEEEEDDRMSTDSEDEERAARVGAKAAAATVQEGVEEQQQQDQEPGGEGGNGAHHGQQQQNLQKQQQQHRQQHQQQHRQKQHQHSQQDNQQQYFSQPQQHYSQQPKLSDSFADHWSPLLAAAAYSAQQDTNNSGPAVPGLPPPMFGAVGRRSSALEDLEPLSTGRSGLPAFALPQQPDIAQIDAALGGAVAAAADNSSMGGGRSGSGGRASGSGQLSDDLLSLLISSLSAPQELDTAGLGLLAPAGAAAGATGRPSLDGGGGSPLARRTSSGTHLLPLNGAPPAPPAPRHPKRSPSAAGGGAAQLLAGGGGQSPWGSRLPQAPLGSPSLLMMPSTAQLLATVPGFGVPFATAGGGVLSASGVGPAVSHAPVAAVVPQPIAVAAGGEGLLLGSDLPPIPPDTGLTQQGGAAAFGGDGAVAAAVKVHEAAGPGGGDGGGASREVMPPSGFDPDELRLLVDLLGPAFAGPTTTGVIGEGAGVGGSGRTVPGLSPAGVPMESAE